MANVLEQLKDEVKVSEACLTGIFWNKPSLYDLYSADKLNRKFFLNDIWGFYFGLGRYMYEHGITVFDDVVTNKFVKDINVQKTFEKYGEYEIIQELMDEMEGKEENLDGHMEEVKKYSLLSKLIDLFGAKVLNKANNYNYKEMTKNELYSYWYDKLNTIELDDEIKYDEYHLLDGLKEFIKNVNENPNVGLPFYDSYQLNKISNGWTDSDVYMYGSFSNAGKTSFTVKKVLMSCIEANEKLVVIANEEGIASFKEKLFVTVGGLIGKHIQRKKYKRGEFTDEDYDKADEIIKWLDNKTSGDTKLITFVYMENYVIRDLERIIKHYYNRGVKNFVIDTHKIPVDRNEQQRWASFVEATKKIFYITRKEGGGLGLRMWITFQLADWARKVKYLDTDAIGEGKAAKNEIAVVFMTRAVWDSEYEGGSDEIEGFRWVKNPNEGDEEEFVIEKFKLSREKTFYLLFTPKNRNGMNNEVGQPILIYEVNFEFNSWREYGWCKIFNNKN